MIPTREDVAQKAGVSVATVSYAFSGKRYVSRLLKERVFSAADELGYQPDAIACAMAGNRTNSICVAAGDISHPLLAYVLKGFQAAAMKSGYFVYICSASDGADELIARRADGIFAAADMGENEIEKLLKRGISIVSACPQHNPQVCSLLPDYESGLKMLLIRLKEYGHKSAAFLQQEEEGIFGNPFDKLHSVYYEVYGHKPKIFTEVDEIKNALKKGEYTAAVCADDLTAYGLAGALRSVDIDIPQRVSLAAIGDAVFSKVFTPPLTALRYFTAEYGERLFSILKANMEDKNIVRKERANPVLVERGSIAGAP